MADLDLSNFSDDELDSFEGFVKEPSTYLQSMSDEHLSVIERAAKAPALTQTQLLSAVRVMSQYRPKAPERALKRASEAIAKPYIKEGLKTIEQVGDTAVGSAAALSWPELMKPIGEAIGEQSVKPLTDYADRLTVGPVRDYAQQLGESVGEKGVTPEALGPAAGLIGTTAGLAGMAGGLMEGAIPKTPNKPGMRINLTSPPAEPTIEVAPLGKKPQPPGATTPEAVGVSKPFDPGQTQPLPVQRPAEPINVSSDPLAEIAPLVAKQKTLLPVEAEMLERMAKEPDVEPSPYFTRESPAVAEVEAYRGQERRIKENRRLIADGLRQQRAERRARAAGRRSEDKISGEPGNPMDKPIGMGVGEPPRQTPFQSAVHQNVQSFVAANKAWQGAKDLVQEVDAATSQQYADLRHIDRDIYEGVVRAESAYHDADYRASRFINGIRDILKSPEERNELAALIVDDIGQATRTSAPARGRDPLAVKIPTLSPAERGRIEAKPGVQEALQYLRDNMVPEVEALSKEGGVQTLTKTKHGVYVQLKKFDPDAQAKGFGKGRSSGGPFTKRPGPKKISGSRERLGTADVYDLDLSNLLQHTYRERMRRIQLNRLHAVLKAKGVSDPKAAPAGWVATPLRAPLLTEKGFLHSGDVYLPPEVSAAYERVLVPDRPLNPLGKAWNKILRTQTGMALLIPAEATAHTLNFVSQLALQPGVGRLAYGEFGRKLTMAFPGIRGMANGFADMFAVGGPKYEGWRNYLSEHGALRTQGFIKGREGVNIPGLEQIRQGVFGLEGFETKARVSLAMLMEAADPKMPQSEIAFRVNNAMGTYVDRLAPQLVRVLKQSGLDPFASAGVAITKGSMRGLLGKSPAGPFKMETLYNGILGTTIGYIIAQKAVDPKHRWPWEIPGAQFGDIIVEPEGSKRAVVIPVALWAPQVARGMRMTGLRGAINAAGKGEDFLGEGLRGIGNSLSSRLGPGMRTIFQLLTNKAPYLTRSGELLQISKKPVPGESTTERLMHRLAPIGRTLAPMSEILSDVPQFGQEPSTKSLRYARRGLEAMGLPSPLLERERVRRGAPVRTEHRELFEATDDIAFRAIQMADPIQRQKFIEEEVMRFEPKDRGKARFHIFRTMKTRKKSIAKTGAQALQK